MDHPPDPAQVPKTDEPVGARYVVADLPAHAQAMLKAVDLDGATIAFIVVSPGVPADQRGGVAARIHATWLHGRATTGTGVPHRQRGHDREALDDARAIHRETRKDDT
jgi:hypothetical protein